MLIGGFNARGDIRAHIFFGSPKLAEKISYSDLSIETTIHIKDSFSLKYNTVQNIFKEYKGKGVYSFMIYL